VQEYLLYESTTGASSTYALESDCWLKESVVNT